jgi:hypothetical protein
MRGIGCLGLVLAVAACAVDASSNLSRSLSGTVIGSAAQTDVALTDSQIYVDVPELTIKARRSRALVDRYDETLAFDGGYVRYQNLYNAAGFSAGWTNIDVIQSAVDSDWFRQRGLTTPVKSLVSVVNGYGTAQYVAFGNAQWRCMVLVEHFWIGTTPSRATSPGNAQLLGSICYSSSDARAPTIEAMTETILRTIRVGSGVNRGASQQAAVPSPAPAAAAPTAVSAPRPPLTSSDFKVAPAGTRFVMNDGYIQIVRVEGYTVITVNAANQTARWAGTSEQPERRHDRSKHARDPVPAHRR